MNDVWFAFALTLFAGMSTGIGSAIAFTAKRSNYRFLSISTGFSAGVMLYVSFVEILDKSADALRISYGEYWAHWVNVSSFFGGILLIGIIDNIIPAAENPHETHSEMEVAPLHDPSAPLPDFYAISEDPDVKSLSGLHDQGAGLHDHGSQSKKLMRMGLFTALAIMIHNFPEGLVTFLAALEDPPVGIAIALAIALHNIPEGISISVPIFYATGDRKKAFTYSLLSGLAEPVGAGVAYGLLLFFTGDSMEVVPQQIMGILLGGVAGIMVYISLDELLPTSRAYGKGHDSILGVVGGMAVMAISLLLMK